MTDRKNLNKALLTLAAVVLLLVLCPAVIAHAAEQTVDVGIPVEEHPELFLPRLVPPRQSRRLSPL